jgi:small subunit ribosomal protein S7
MSYQQIKKNIFKGVAFGSVAFKRATFGIKSSKTLRVTASLPGYQLHTSAQPLCSITSIDLVAKLPSSVTNFGEAAGGLRERFIQRLILDGKKSTATKVFDESLQLLKKRIEQHNLINDINAQRFNLHSLNSLTKEEVFLIALRKAQPWITTSSLRRGGKKVIIPEMLTPSQQESIAIRWLILNSRSITGKSIAECLASEFFGCLTNQGKTINQREQLHKLAEANRA